MQGVWKTWIYVWCTGVLVFGVGLMLTAWPATNGFTAFFMGLISSGSFDTADLDAPMARFAFGLMGCVTIGWALLIFGAVNWGGVLGAPVWQWLTASFVVWYLIDGFVSVSTGFWLNAVSNSVLLITYLVPVLASGALRKRV